MRVVKIFPEIPNMEILFYCSAVDGAGEELRSIMENFTPRVPVRIFRSWESFSKELMNPGHNETVVLILISRKEELLDAVSIRDLIHGYKLILVIPDGEEETVSLGHVLRPNFMTSRKEDFHEVEIVLKKMLRLD